MGNSVLSLCCSNLCAEALLLNLSVVSERGEIDSCHLGDGHRVKQERQIRQLELEKLLKSFQGGMIQNQILA